MRCLIVLLLAVIANRINSDSRETVNAENQIE